MSRVKKLRRIGLVPLVPRSVPLRPSPLLETVTTVLELADRPMRAREIHAAAEHLLGEPLRWSSVKGILAAYTSGGDRRFQRIRRGCYRMGRSRSDAGPTLRVVTLLRDDPELS